MLFSHFFDIFTSFFQDPLKKFEYLRKTRPSSVMIRATPNSVRWDEINRIQYRFQALHFHSDGENSISLLSYIYWFSYCCHSTYTGPATRFSKWGAKTQPIFRCYNFSFQTLDTWKSIFWHFSIFDHWKLTLNRVSTN